MSYYLQHIIDIIGITTTVLLLIFSSFLLTTKKRTRLSIKFLFCFLVINSVYIIAFLILVYVKPNTLFETSIFYSFHSTGFLFGPILYFYTKITIYGERKIRIREYAHLIPFIIALAGIFTILNIIANKSQIWLSAQEAFAFDFLLNLQVLIYMVFAVLEVRIYRRKIREFYSSLTGLYYSWLAVVLYGFFFMWFIDLLHFILNKIIVLPLSINLSLTTISLSINFIFAVLIFYKGLTHPELFNSGITEEKPKYEKSKLTKDDANSYLQKLQKFMSDEKPYLIPNLNINELSEKVDIPMRFLSQIINDLLNQNFFDFINYYRIEESKNYLSDPKCKKLNILEILYEVGFNSKSTFNKVFKEFTGHTPTEYRQQHLH